MPVYEYECANCNRRFDKRQGFNDKPSALCPECSSQARRIFQPSPIIFKGSGFYVTDHRKANPASAVESPKEAPQKKETKGKAT